MKNHLDFSGNSPAFPAPTSGWTGITERTHISIELLKALLISKGSVNKPEIHFLVKLSIYGADTLMEQLKETHKE